MSYVILTLLIVLLVLSCVVGWVLTLFGLPGNWLMVLAAGSYVWLGPVTGILQITWQTALAAALLAGAGELAELVAGMYGARRAGGSRRAALYALGGSLVGAIGGSILGLPIPIIGSAVAAVIGGAAGALVGASWAEHSRGETADKTWKVGQAAFWGRLVGTGLKTAFGTVIVLVVLIALLV